MLAPCEASPFTFFCTSCSTRKRDEIPEENQDQGECICSGNLPDETLPGKNANEDRIKAGEPEKSGDSNDESSPSWLIPAIVGGAIALLIVRLLLGFLLLLGF